MLALVCWYWGNKVVQLLWKTVWQFLKKLNQVLLYDPVVQLILAFPQRIGNWDSKILIY